MSQERKELHSLTAAGSALRPICSCLLRGFSDYRAVGTALCKYGPVCGKNGASEELSNQTPPETVNPSEADESLAGHSQHLGLCGGPLYCCEQLACRKTKVGLTVKH